MSIKDRFFSALLIAAAAMVSAVYSASSADPDVFWHLKVGEWIMAHHAVPRTDIYSWSVYGHAWTDHEWLWQVLISAVYRYAGLIGLCLIVFLAGLFVGLIVRQALVMRRSDESLAALAGALSPLLLIEWLKPWPQAGVYVMFAAYLYLSLRRDWGRIEVIYAALLGLAWGNVHASCVLLPLLLLAECAWRFLFEKKLDRWRLAAAIASAAATLLNPRGIGIWAYAIKETYQGAYRASIAEWAPYYFSPSPIVLAFFIGLIILFVAVRQRKEMTMEFIRAAGFWALALLSRIYTPYAALSTAVLFGLLAIRTERGTVRRMCAVFLAFAIFLAIARPPFFDLETVAEKDGYPVKAVQYMKDHGIDHVYNDHGWGGYLIWEGVPVYIDGRNDVYGELFNDYLNAGKEDDPAGKVIRDAGADVVLTVRNGSIDAALKESPLWKVAYRDSVAVVYISVDIEKFQKI